jgi:hypothetical protein
MFCSTETRIADAKDRGQAPPFLKENKMEKAKTDSVIAVFADHPAAEAVVKNASRRWLRNEKYQCCR